MRRVGIVGTAGSFKQTPFNDPTIELWSLNDAYMMPGGLPRVDAWFDLHPMDHFYFAPPKDAQGRQPAVYAHQVPFGYYVRPTDHLSWLASQTVPVWLHPQHATQYPASATWPQARAFPKAAIEAHFGRYFGSTPSWMMALAILDGVKDIEVYGIHLATESEYLDQRPNFEFLCGCLLGSGKRTMTVADGKRIYESADGRLVLPVSSPVLDAKFQYAFEPSPRRKIDPLQWEIHKANVKKSRRLQALLDRSWGVPWVTLTEPDKSGAPVTRRVSPSTLRQEIKYYDALLADYQDQMAQVGQ
jgi:hypothetical protein